MPEQKPAHRSHRKNPKQILAIVACVATILIIALLILVPVITKPEHVAGEVKDGTVTYSPKINNVSKTDSSQSVEIKARDGDYNSITITTEILSQLKSNAALSEGALPNRDLYNLKKAKAAGLISDDTTIKDYYVIITGFNNSAEFIEFCEDALGLIKNYQ